MNYKELKSILSLALVFGIFVFIVFLSGCTQSPSGGVSISASNGLFISKVYYNKEVKANTNIEIKVELENRGDEAKNIKVYLTGLSNKWNPYPVPAQTIPSLKNKEKVNATFQLVTPLVEDNITYGFGVHLEYEYSSKYSAMLRLEKDKETNEIRASVTNEKLLYEAPLTLSLTSVEVDEANKKVVLYYKITDSGSGELLNDKTVSIASSGISCEAQTKLEEREGEFKCEANIPNFDKSYNLEYTIRLSYTYSYQTSDNAYEIKVLKV